jgi:uncharacterized protein
MIEGLPLVTVIVCLIALSWYRSLRLVVVSLLQRRTNAAAKWFRRRLVPAWLDLVNLVFSLVVCGCLWYAGYVEPYQAEVVRVGLVTPKLPASAVPIRLVQISDLHCDPKVRLEGELPRIIQELKPDLIVFTGDAINSPEALANFQDCISALVEVAPVFAVAGNWEAWWFKDVDLYEGTGVEVLDGTAQPFTVRGQEIWLAGAAVDRENQLAPALRKVPASKFTIALHHFPELFDTAAANGADLMVAGDTHGGGQVRLPLLGEMIRIKRFGGYYTSGLHQKGSASLYVNRGIGMEGRHAPRIRFNCPPEVTLFTIKGTGVQLP